MRTPNKIYATFLHKDIQLEKCKLISLKLQINLGDINKQETYCKMQYCILRLLYELDTLYLVLSKDTFEKVTLIINFRQNPLKNTFCIVF